MNQPTAIEGPGMAQLSQAKCRSKALLTGLVLIADSTEKSDQITTCITAASNGRNDYAITLAKEAFQNAELILAAKKMQPVF